MTTALYRKSSYEILAISLTDDPFTQNISDYFDVIDNATYPDGTVIVDPSGTLRVLGYAKILDGTVVQNATQQEIDTFIPAGIDDKNQQQAANALRSLQQDAKFRMAIFAVVRGIVKEDNEQRLWIRTFMAAVAASTSLGNFQSRVAALDNPADRELADAKTYILNQINKDD